MFRFARHDKQSGQTRGFLTKRRFRQMQSEWLQPPQIQLQRRVLLGIWPARFLEFRVCLGPAFLSIEDHAIPKIIASSEMLRFCFSREPKRLVNLVPFLRVYTTKEI